MIIFDHCVTITRRTIDENKTVIRGYFCKKCNVKIEKVQTIKFVKQILRHLD